MPLPAASSLDALTDVEIDTPGADQVVAYELASQLFKNQSPVAGGPSPLYFNTLGADPALGSRLYFLGKMGGNNFGSNALAANRLFAAPFVFERGGAIDQFQVEITAAGSGSAGDLGHLAIYETETESDFYPGARVAAIGTFLVDAIAFRTIVPAEPFEVIPGKLYWYAWVSPRANSFRTVGLASLPGILGHTTGSQAILTTVHHAFASAAPPADYPAPPGVTVTDSVGTFPIAVGARFIE